MIRYMLRIASIIFVLYIIHPNVNAQTLPEDDPQYAQSKFNGNIPNTIPPFNYTGSYGSISPYTSSSVLGDNCPQFYEFTPQDSLTDCDDCYTGPINLMFPFSFYGTQVISVYVNSNGVISLDDPYPFFQSYPFPSTANSRIIAPFFTDVDLTADSIVNTVYWATIPNFDGTGIPAFVVTWKEVGYYNLKKDKTNTFQCILKATGVTSLPGDYNMYFRYGDMDWATGEIPQNGILGGFGGVPSTVGIDVGNGTHFIQIGRFSDNNSIYNGPNNTSGIHFLDDNCFFFNVANCPLQVDAGNNQNLQCSTGIPVQLGGYPTVMGGTAPYQYQWSPSIGLDDPTIANPVAFPPVTTTYQLTVTDVDGCLGTGDVTVLTLGNCLTPPQIICDTVFTVMEGELISFAALASDIDGDIVNVTASPLPSNDVTFTFNPGNPANGHFYWLTQAGDAGIYTFQITAIDNHSQTTSIGITLYVMASGPGVPTLSQWGLIFLTLLMLIVGLLVSIQPEQKIKYASSNNTQALNISLLFFPSYAKTALSYTAILSILTLAGCTMYEGSLTAIDFYGTLLCFFPMAYLLHLMFWFVGKDKVA